MNEEERLKYLKAGKIAGQAREYGASLIKPGITYLEVADAVEQKILDSGAKIAFPVNISANHIAAHYTPSHDDTTKFFKGDIIKLDVGAHIDGYIADTAITIEVGTNEQSELILASSEALDAAIHLIKPDLDLAVIGQAVQETITGYGYKPIDNLTGHSLERYNLHAGLSIPNVPQIAGRRRPQIGDAIAIEPFASSGAGHVTNGKGSNIYICQGGMRSRFIRDNHTKLLYHRLSKVFNTLPFSQRRCEMLIPNSALILKRLTMLGMVHHYPQLPDADAGLVSQKEHTIIVTEDGCEVTTKV